MLQHFVVGVANKFDGDDGAPIVKHDGSSGKVSVVGQAGFYGDCAAVGHRVGVLQLRP